MNTYHFNLTLPEYMDEKPAKVEWQASSFDVAYRIVQSLHPEFIVEPNDYLNEV